MAGRELNATGLAAGDRMTWQDCLPAGDLPIPQRYDSSGIGMVGDDASIVGSVGLQDTDQPAVWRRG